MKFSGSTSRNYSMRSGNDQSTDAPEDQTDANYDTRNPWFEFSQNITFQGDSDIKKLSSITQANLKKVSGVAIASVAKVSGVSS